MMNQNMHGQPPQGPPMDPATEFQYMQDMAEFEYQEAQAVQAAIAAQTEAQAAQVEHLATVQHEIGRLEMRGTRLRRAAFSTGICQAVSVVCSVYMIFAIRLMLLDWEMLDKTSYNIQANWIQWNVGVFTETLNCILNILIGILLGMIFIGAGVNPASCSLIVIFKLMEQAIVGVSIVFMIMVGIFVNDDNALSATVKNYFYSETYPEIGLQITYLLLLFNKYGIIFAHIFGGVHYCLLAFVITHWGVLPRHLGYAFGFAGPAYIINAFLNLIISKYKDDYAIFFALPGVIAHFWLAAWMLVNTPHPAKDRGKKINAPPKEAPAVSPRSIPLNATTMQTNY